LEQLLDPSYAPGLYVLMMVVEVDATGVVSGWLIHEFPPYRNPDGSKTQEGYDCDWASAERVDS
jgi:hypothetical protein